LSDALPFGEWLKRRRRALDLTQQALADLVHCSIVTIRKIESSDLIPSKELARELAIALQVPEADRASFVQFARSREAEMPAAFRSEPAARSDAAPRVYRVPASLDR
jgi:transcriptional regulator with XRE-family HTH domain